MIRSLACVALVAGLLLSHAVFAEPYLAVRTGFKCMACHTNPTGGGKRNEFGNTYAQYTLAARHIEDAGEQTPPWNGSLNRFIGIGADFRGELTVTDVPDQSTTSEFSYEESLVYLQLQAVPDHVSIYVDHRLGPGGADTREAYGLFSFMDKHLFIKAGRFFLPFGLRLEDDDAFTRSVSGINFETPDDGVELAVEYDAWSAQVAISNGAGGGPEQDDDKRFSANTVYSQPGWRAGVSLNSNETMTGSRDMVALYGGVRTGSISWLFEYDLITDEIAGLAGESEQQVGLLEANVLLSQGSNLKLTYEVQKPDSGLNVEDRNRVSAVWEYFPIQFVQVNLGYRTLDGPDDQPLTNRDIFFAQLHLFF